MYFFVVFMQKTAFEMRISDWSSDVCSSDLGKMGEAAFVDGDAGDREPRDQRLAQFAANLFVVAAQRHFLMLDIVIGIARADRAHRSLDLRNDEFLVIVDVEQGLRGVGHPPDDRKSTRLNSSH